MENDKNPRAVELVCAFCGHKQWSVPSDPFDCLKCRDMFAMAAITGCCQIHEQITDPKEFSISAYEIADAMLEARKNGKV